MRFQEPFLNPYFKKDKGLKVALLANQKLLSVRSEKFNPGKLNPHRKNNQKPNLKTNQYETIGTTLCIAEASIIKVGIPWLPPTKERRELIKQYHSPINDFIRVSLVCVSTKTLESYCDDLETFQKDNKSFEDLFIEEIKGIDRFASSGFLFVALAFFTFSFCIMLKTGYSAAVALSLLSATPAALLAMFSCNELQRRANFHSLLYKELLRRRGQDEGNTKGILLSLET